MRKNVNVELMASVVFEQFLKLTEDSAKAAALTLEFLLEAIDLPIDLAREVLVDMVYSGVIQPPPPSEMVEP